MFQGDLFDAVEMSLAGHDKAVSATACTEQIAQCVFGDLCEDTRSIAILRINGKANSGSVKQ